MNALHRLLDFHMNAMRDGEGAGAGAGPGAGPGVTLPANPNGTGQVPAGYFSTEYVRELRAESKGYRLKATEQQQKAEAAEAAKIAAEKAVTEAEAKALAKANERIMRSELKAEALKLGMIDLDGLAFIDYAALKLDDKGELVGGAEALAKLKEAKAYLFAAPGGNTGNGKQPPPPKDPKDPVDARKMSPDEYKAYKATFGLR